MFDRRNIIIQAPAFTQSGYGSHSRDFLMGLFNTGKYNLSLVPVGWGNSSVMTPRKDVDDALVFMANNRVSEGSEFVWMQIGVPHEFRRMSAKQNIGVTAGLEATPYPPQWKDMCNQMTALIVTSDFVKKEFESIGVTIPIYVVPEGVNTEVFNNNPIPEQVDPDSILAYRFPTEFNYLVAGQWLPGNVGEDRKNIPASILAVIDALVDNVDVGVVLKTYTHNSSSPDHYMTQERLRGLLGPKSLGRVHLIHGTLSDAEMAAMYKHPQIKAFVSLTHGEGYFRPLIEAAASDLPVLVTGWSGHMDYIKPDMATVLDFQFAEVPPSCWAPQLLGPGQKWAVPDFDKAKNRIKRCYEKYDVAKNRALEQGKFVRQEFNLVKIDQILDDVMSLIVNSDQGTVVTVGNQIKV